MIMYRLNDIVSTLLKSLKLSYYPTSNECFLNVNANVSYSIIFITLHFVYIYMYIYIHAHVIISRRNGQEMFECTRLRSVRDSPNRSTDFSVSLQFRFLGVLFVHLDYYLICSSWRQK